MAQRDRNPAANVRVIRPIADMLDATASTLDVATTALVNAALAGLVRSGQIERFVEIGMQANPEVAAMMEQRRPRKPSRRWTREDTPSSKGEVVTADGSRKVIPDGAGVWRHGSFLLRFHGEPHAQNSKDPDRGWHLHGSLVPGGHRLVGSTRREAEERANGLIDRLLAEERQSVTEPHETAERPGAGISAPDPGLRDALAETTEAGCDSP